MKEVEFEIVGIRVLEKETGKRFLKQNLFLESYQTPDLQDLDNWTLLAQEAKWLLWTASEEVENVCEKWQKYSQPKAEKGGRKTPSQTRKAMERLILTFESERYLPKKCKKGLGRKKGKRCELRKHYKVVKKWRKLEEIIKTRPHQE